LFQSTFAIDCGSQHFDCQTGAQYIGYSCQAFYPVVPLEDPDIFGPVPAFWHFASTGEFDFAAPFPTNSTSQIVSNKVVWAFIINFQSGSTIFAPYNSTKDPLDTCLLKVENIQPLSNFEGEGLERRVVDVESKGMECDLKEFRNLSREMDLKIESIYQGNVDVIATKFEVDKTTFLKGWQGCASFIESFISEVKYSQKLSNSTDCTNEMYSNSTFRSQDVCCNEKLRWTTCCLPRDVTYPATKYVVPSAGDDSEKDLGPGKRPISQCGNPECFRSLLEDYVSFLSQEISDHSCQKGVQNQAVEETKNLDFYRNCKFEYFGDDNNGKPCYSDGDCKVRCDLMTQKCVYDSVEERDQLVDGFFQCLSVNMSVEQRQFVMKVFSINETSTEDQMNEMVAWTLKEQYLNSGNCWDHSGISLSDGIRWVPDLKGNYCPPCPGYSCLDDSCRIPLRCEKGIRYGRPGTLCAPTPFQLGSDASGCESEKYCTFDDQLSESDCPQNRYFCGVCETPDNCTQVFFHSPFWQ